MRRIAGAMLVVGGLFALLAFHAVSRWLLDYKLSTLGSVVTPGDPLRAMMPQGDKVLIWVVLAAGAILLAWPEKQERQPPWIT